MDSKNKKAPLSADELADKIRDGSVTKITLCDGKTIDVSEIKRINNNGNIINI